MSEKPKLAFVLAALLDAGIVRISIEFAGSGDSGWVEDIIFYEIEDSDLYQKNYLMDSVGLEEVDITERLDIEIDVVNYIEDLAYGSLNSCHPGWEINDGSYGTLWIDVTKGVLHADYNYRVMESVAEPYEDQLDTEI